MLDTRGQIGEIVGPHGMGGLAVVENTAALQNEVDFFFAIVGDRLAISSIQFELRESSDRTRHPAVGITRAEYWRVMTSCRREITGRLPKAWNVSMQPRGFHF